MGENLREKAYEEIKRRIVFFELKPMEKLFETELANELKISRTPVREALLMLQNERLIESVVGKGFFVKKLTQKEVREYLAIRIALEDFIAPLIIENITKSEVKALKKNIMDAEKAIEKDDLYGLIAYETGFHKILYQSSRSEVFVETISHLTDKFQWLRAIALNAQGGGQQSVGDHVRICEAIEQKDLNGLKTAGKEHLRHAEEKFEAVRRLFP